MSPRPFLVTEAARLGRDRRGAALAAWALSGAAILGLTSVTLDLARAEAIRHRAHDATGR